MTTASCCTWAACTPRSGSRPSFSILTERLRARGFSAFSVVLRMSREEIGSYLGLTLETVSRTFSKFQASGLLFVRQRQIQITDPVGLQHLLDDVTA